MNIKNKVMTAPREESTGFDLGHLLGQLIDHRWIIVAVTAFFMLVGTLYTLFATPIYSADAMVQVEQKNSSTVLSDLQTLMPATPESDTEIQILESRMVIGKTVSDLGLDTVVEQKYFPIIGKGLSRLMGNKPAQIAISRLDIPRTIDKRSVELEVNSPTTYTVTKDGDELFKGQVGRLEQHGEITMLVSGIQAEEGTSFTVTKLNELQAINSVLANLTVADKGKDTGVLGLQYVGEDPEHISQVLNQIVNNYLLQNVERKSEQAEKSLEFLRNQLPQDRKSVV